MATQQNKKRKIDHKLRAVILGGGISGLIAAVEAHSLGVSIDILEKTETLGHGNLKFTIDLSPENSEFLKGINVDVSSLKEDNLAETLIPKLITHLRSQKANEVRVILNSRGISLLTDEEKKTALGFRYQRSYLNKGKGYSNESNIFGDVLIFAVSRDDLVNICGDKFDLADFVLTRPKETSSLNEVITFARKSGQIASESSPRNLHENGARQPLPFVDKDQVFRGVALKPNQWVPLRLLNRIQLNKFNHLFRFCLPDPNQQAGLFCGQYISIRAIIDGKEIIRYYSPVSRNSDYGQLDLMIKIEENTTNKPMEAFLSNLQVGQVVEFKGPIGGFEYHRNMYKNVGMIAGGTGITPMVQIIRSVANHPEDETTLSLLYGNYGEDDILCKEELSYYSMTRTNIKVYISLDNAPGKWSMGHGFINEDMIKQTLPGPSNDTIILLCGPPPMVKGMIVMLKKLGYTDSMIFSFV